MLKKNAIPWTNMVNKTLWYTVYKDCDVHEKVKRYLFVVKDKNGAGLPSAVHSCYSLANALQSTPGWESYQIRVLVGPNSGAEIDGLYVELLPITKGTTDTPEEKEVINASDR